VAELGSIFEPTGPGPRGRDLHADVTVPAWALGLPFPIEVAVPLDLAAEGGYARRVVHAFDAGDRLHLNLPAGFPDGGTLRLRGQGEAHEAGRPGDLLLCIHVDRTRSEPPPEVRAMLAAMPAVPPPAAATRPQPSSSPELSERLTWLAAILALIAALALFG
jgi:hypothetical protein